MKALTLLLYVIYLFIYLFFPHECKWRCLCKRSGSGHPGPDLHVNMRGHHTSCQSTSPNCIATPHVWEWTMFIAGHLQLSYICSSQSFLSISLNTPTLFLCSLHNAAQSSLSLEHPTHPPSFPPVSLRRVSELAYSHLPLPVKKSET